MDNGTLPLLQSQIATAATVPLAKPPPRQLVKATLSDLSFVNSLQKKFGKSLGFLPTQAIEINLEAGNVTLTTENADSAGYMLVRPVLAWCPGMASIVQAAVCMDAQRRHHGLALLLLLEEQARGRGQVALQANCAIGVEANEFWQAAGFKPIAHLTPATKSGREIICWRKPLQRALPEWFTQLPKKAGGRALPVQSLRNGQRKATDQSFAEQFLAGRPQGTAGLITSLEELHRKEVTDDASNTNQ
jgi:N-acetylglutamate synthase-like GNAT family acetyltransferase